MSSWLSGLSELRKKVTKAIPIDAETIQKLTLTTPELTAERLRLDEEEKRKERVKDSLAGIFPWETRDEERDILVEECKEAIMALSSNDDTFFGPYKMPPLGVKTENEDDKKEDADEIEEEELHGEDAGEEDEKRAVVVVDKDPTPESLEKLAKLEPLPPLLGNFDLDSHVGLIQKMLKTDPKLVDRQSRLSGGGEREKTFWRNYFFHCAYTRYEAGLSIDEIWSDQPPTDQTDKATPTETVASTNADETTITFEGAGQKTESSTSDAAAPAPSPAPTQAESKQESASQQAPLFEQGAEQETSPGGKSEFEMVGDTQDDDGEMDELEAEIARELED